MALGRIENGSTQNIDAISKKESKFDKYATRALMVSEITEKIIQVAPLVYPYLILVKQFFEKLM